MIEKLRALAYQRGVRGSSGGFLGLWVLIAGFRLIKKLAGNEQDLVYRGTLEPGQQLVITHETETHG